MSTEENKSEDKTLNQQSQDSSSSQAPAQNQRPNASQSPADQNQNNDQGGPQGRRRRKPKRQAPSHNLEDSGFVEKVITINRVAKATKGGTKLSFTALVVVGDTKGRAGYALGKAGEVAVAIRKAFTKAKKSMIKVNMRGTTITHQVIGEWGGAQVLLKPASEGTGVIASGPVRAICDGAGIHNILTKCHRSNNPINVVKATLEGLSRLKEVRVEESKPDAEPAVAEV